MSNQESIFELEEVINQKIHGEIVDLHTTNYGVVKATVKLRGYEDRPTTVVFDYTQTVDKGKPHPNWLEPEIPLKLGDYVTVETKVIKFGDLKK